MFQQNIALVKQLCIYIYIYRERERVENNVSSLKFKGLLKLYLVNLWPTPHINTDGDTMRTDDAAHLQGQGHVGHRFCPRPGWGVAVFNTYRSHPRVPHSQKGCVGGEGGPRRSCKSP